MMNPLIENKELTDNLQFEPLNYSGIIILWHALFWLKDHIGVVHLHI